MTSRILRPEEIEALERFPAELAVEEVAAQYTLSEADLVAVRERRGDANRLGFALLLCAIRHLGFVPEDLREPPAGMVGWLAEQLAVDPGVLADYGARYKTVVEHRAAALAYLGIRPATGGDLKRLGDWLTERALEHERARLLVDQACAWLRVEQLLRPGVSVLERAVVAARGRAAEELALRLEPITRIVGGRLDDLLIVAEELRRTPLAWLAEPATATNPRAIGAQLDKLAFLRVLGAEGWGLTGVNPNRRRQLAGEAQRRTNQALQRMRPERRWPVLVAFCSERSTELVDELVALADEALQRTQTRSANALGELKKAVAVAASDKVTLFTRLARLVLDPAIPPERLRAVIFAELGEERLAQALEEAEEIPLPDDDAYLDLLLHRYPQLRAWTPRFLDALDFQAGPGGGELVAAIGVLRELNRTGRRALPADAPLGFMSRTWRARLVRPDGRMDRRVWELGLLVQLRLALRSGQVWVAGSRRYNDPATLLLPVDVWVRERDEAVRMLGVDPDPALELERLTDEFHRRMGVLDDVLAGGAEVRLDDGHLNITPLAAEEPPPGLDHLEAAILQRLPRVSLPELLIEVDSWVGFSGRLTHAAGATTRAADLDVHRYAAVLASATNIGLGPMADAAGLSYERLAWAAEWYLRPDTLEPATADILRLQHAQPLAATWGDATRSSADGQRFTIPVTSATGRWLPRYFGLRHRGLSIYTWTSDRWGQFATKVITADAREGVHSLDGLLDNALEYRPVEHSTDTGGWTDNLFALCDLVGIQFAPRLRDVADQKLHRLDAVERYRHAGSLLTGRIDIDLIASQWDDLLRVGASLERGWVSASLLLERWQARPRQNPLTRALQEYGRLQRTLFLLHYLAAPEYRREINRQLNRTESFHALRRRIFFGQHGHVRRPHLDEQTDQALALNLVVAAVTCWNTTYMAAAVDQLRHHRWEITDDQLAHLSPTLWQHINPYGTYRFDQRPPTGRRPLRTPRP